MVLNAHAGTKYGIPFPIYCRASFGILGANVPALLARAGRLRLVRHPVVDRRLGDLQDPRHLRSRRGESWRRFRWLGINPAQLGLFPGVLGGQHGRDLSGHRLDPVPA